MKNNYLNKLFDKKNVDAIISVAPQTRLWYSGVQTSDGFLIIEKNKAFLFVDGRYIEYANKNAKNVEVILLNKNSLKDFFDKKNYKKIALERDYLVYEMYEFLRNLVKPSKILWIKGQELRIEKNDEELMKMKKTVDISLSAYEELVKWLKEGYTEREIASYLNYLLKKHGAEKESFDEIVAIGENAAEAHHHPTNKKLKIGDIIKIDFGALHEGYSADITRTFIFGGENKVKNKELLKILNIVKAAAKAGRDAVKPGIKVSEIDKICRDFITKEGYGKYFTHSTGHGLGIDVHELPYVRKEDDTILAPGMVITVEPGIYIEGLGGARIEDDVLVTSKGRYILSRPEEV